MPVPDYETMMLPLLRLLQDRREHRVDELRDSLAAELGLSDEDRRIMQPSGRQPLFNNRMLWARFYLDKAALLETPKRGSYKITQRGLDALATHPAQIDVAFLKRYAEFRQFLGREHGAPAGETGCGTPQTETLSPRPPRTGGPHSTPTATETPEDALATAYQRLRATLEGELLDRVRAV
jgi:restriction system protein